MSCTGPVHDISQMLGGIQGTRECMLALYASSHPRKSSRASAGQPLLCSNADATGAGICSHTLCGAIPNLLHLLFSPGRHSQVCCAKAAVHALVLRACAACSIDTLLDQARHRTGCPSPEMC